MKNKKFLTRISAIALSSIMMIGDAVPALASSASTQNIASSSYSEVNAYVGKNGPSKVIGITEEESSYSYLVDAKDMRIPYTILDGDDVTVGMFESTAKFKETYGVDLNKDGYYDYYQYGNKCYRYYSSYYNSSDTGSGYVYYLYSEMSFDSGYASFTWNHISDDTVLQTKNGDKLRIGYQIELDGKNVENGTLLNDGTEKIYITTWNDYTDRSTVMKKGESRTVRVRAIYYYYDKAKSVNVPYMYGEWSEPYKYTFNGIKKTPVVTGVKASANGNKVEMSWTDSVIAEGYRVQYFSSKTPLNVTNENFQEYYKDADYYGYDYVGGNKYEFNIEGEDPYTYIRVCISSATTGYFASFAYSNVVSVVTTRKVNTPNITGLKVEEINNGEDFQLSWNPVDANVAVYAIESDKNIKYYNYGMLDAYSYRVEEEDEWHIYLSDYLDSKTRTDISKYVRTFTTSGMSGTLSTYGLKPGVKYTFYAHTYDNSDYARSIKKTPIGVNVDGITGTADDKGFEYYTPMSAASKVSYTAKLSKPYVSTSVTKNSVSLNMSGGYYYYDDTEKTGYEIYKKSGSKYKKIATTTEDVYTDENLKENTKYNYKVRAYYYDKETKKTTYSNFMLKSATTSSPKGLELKITKASTSSVKLQWTKVSGATKYEIYRGNTENVDEKEIEKLLNSGNFAESLYGYNFELIKTIKKASTTKYTDKKLSTGETYHYIVIAYNKLGKKTVMQSVSDSVTMAVSTPQNVKTTIAKNKVKVTWDADKFASKYELKYTVYDKNGNPKTSTPVVASTKKNSYTIKIASGESVKVSLRAYGKNKTYSSWTSAHDSTSLAAVSNIKASYDSSKNAVKISWKKVSGAKYYKVYRSTRLSVYNTDEKRYEAIGSNITKERNDDAYYDNVGYEEYYGIYGSITGTSVYDYAELENGVKYYYYVVAYGEKNTEIQTYVRIGNSLRSGSGKPGTVVCATAPSITLKNSAKKTVKVSYKKVTGAKKYEIYRSTSKKGKYTKIATTKKTTYTDKKVKKGKTYYYKVKVIGVSGLKTDFTVTSSAKKIKVKK